MPLEDPLIFERLVSDYFALHGKYDLPNSDALLNDPSWYEHRLIEIAGRSKIDIVPTSDCGNFFRVYDSDAAYFTHLNRAGVDIKRGSMDEYEDSLENLKHEIVHGIQSKLFPEMPIEAMEYEAYLVGVDLRYLEEHEGRERFFGTDINFSVTQAYKQGSDDSNRIILPKWYFPEYFIQNIDNIDLRKMSRLQRSLQLVAFDHADRPSRLQTDLNERIAT